MIPSSSTQGHVFKIKYALTNTMPQIIDEKNTFFYWPQTQHMGIPGQGKNQSHRCDLCHSCSNAGSLTHCATVETPLFSLYALLFS